MKLLLILLPLLLLTSGFMWYRGYRAKPETAVTVSKGSFYDLSVGGLEGGTIRMADYKGKFVLCVNVASKCGNTPQYKDLQTLADRFKDRLVVIGFPCNQFMMQEPGSASDIAAFCERNYGVTFPMTEKIDVKGKGQHPVYQWLCHQSLNGVSEHEVKWNFQKFLVSPDGQLIGNFAPGMNPLSPEIVTQIGQ